MNEVKSKQIALILLMIIPGSKYLSMPAIFAQQAGRDGWIAISLLLLVDFVCFFFLLWAIKQNKNSMSFYEVLCKTISKAGAKLVMAVFFVFVTARLILLSSATFDLYSTTFSISVNWYVFTAVIALFTIFLVSRGFSSIARLSGLVVTLVMLALALIIVSPLSHINLNSLLPVLENGFSPVAKTMFSGGVWFSDYIFVYFVMDKIKDKQKVFTSNLICFAAGALLTVVMNVLFTSLYGEMAQNTTIAISRVSQYALVSSAKGKLDWLSLSIWSMTLLIKLAVFTFSACKSLEHIFEIKSGHRFWLGLVVAAFYALPLFVPVNQIQDIVMKYLNIPFFLVQYAIPLLMPLLVYFAHKKADAESHRLVRSVYENHT